MTNQNITYTWKINDLERNVSNGYVFAVFWTIEAKSNQLDKNGENVKTIISGSLDLEKPENLIPYEDLTEDLVIQWIEEKLGEYQILRLRKCLNEQIEILINPQSQIGHPWS